MISKDAIALVKHFEGCRLTAYKCPAGVWTIGYGHTGADVKPGLTITQEQAEELLEDDLQLLVGPITRACLPHMLKQNQLDALASFVFNVGIGAFQSSTMLKFIKSGQLADAAGEFARWTRGGGKILPGLISRRAAERALFERG